MWLLLILAQMVATRTFAYSMLIAPCCGTLLLNLPTRLGRELSQPASGRPIRLGMPSAPSSLRPVPFVPASVGPLSMLDRGPFVRPGWELRSQPGLKSYGQRAHGGRDKGPTEASSMDKGPTEASSSRVFGRHFGCAKRNPQLRPEEQPGWQNKILKTMSLNFMLASGHSINKSDTGAISVARSAIRNCAPRPC